MDEKLTIKNGWDDFIKRAAIKKLPPQVQMALEVAYLEGALHMLYLCGQGVRGDVDFGVLLKTLSGEVPGVLEKLNKIQQEYPQNEKTKH